MGWNKDKIESLLDVLDDANRYKYELDNCVRGCYTKCHTYKELASLVHELSERLLDCETDLDYVKEDDDEDD